MSENETPSSLQHFYNSVFILNTVLYTFLKENVFNYHELRLLVIISFILVCDLSL